MKDVLTLWVGSALYGPGDRVVRDDVVLDFDQTFGTGTDELDSVPAVDVEHVWGGVHRP